MEMFRSVDIFDRFDELSPPNVSADKKENDISAIKDTFSVGGSFHQEPLYFQHIEYDKKAS